MKYLTLYNDDCSKILPTLGDRSVDMVLTDIPYDEVNRASSGLRELDKGVADEMTFDLEFVLTEAVRVTKGSLYIFCGINQVSPIREHFTKEGLSTRLIVWEKTNPSPMNGEKIWLSGVECCVFGRKPNATFNRHCKNTVFRFSVGTSKRHPTEKPVALLEELITASTNEGDTVLDFTMGSGSTGEACLKHKRKFIGVELNHDYFILARNRLEDYQASRIDLPFDDVEVQESKTVSLFDFMGGIVQENEVKNER